jgi:hypothetical protein
MRLGKNNTNQQNSVGGAKSPSPRICMPTWRNFTRRPFQCSLYEAQDVLVEVDDVDLVHLDMGWGARFNQRWLRIPLYHDVSRKLLYANLGLKKLRLTKEYDVFITVLNHYWDIPYVNAIENWRDHCKTSICWIDELWASELPSYKYWLDALSQFDYVFVGLKGSVSPLSKALNRPCYWLPGGVDALRFSPFPNSPNRVIDVYSVGRRQERVHGEMLKAAELGGFFYIYDTLSNIPGMDVWDHRQHRNLFASMAKRSRCFMVAKARTGDRQAESQVEVPYRYFEGAAAGAVLVGEIPDCDAYKVLFPWPDAVVPVQPDGSDILSVLSDLRSDRERSAAISARNTREALLHHDWVYRWKEMFRVAGIAPSPRTAARDRRLEDMANCCEELQDNSVDAH